MLFSLPVKGGDDAVLPYSQAYVDIRNFLYIFQNGSTRLIEQQAIRSFKSGGSRVAYVNNANDLIVYENGQKHKLGDMTATTYELSQAFVYYKRDQMLGVFEEGQSTPLTYFIRDFKVSDSLLAFRDRNVDILRVYYHGNIRELEITLTGGLSEYKTGENTVAYVNNTGFFKVYAQDQIWQLDNVAPDAFEAGGNIVAYVDGFYNYLKVYYGNKILVLEKLKPQSFKAGVDLVAYVADDNSFKVFNRGKLLKIESYIPDFYEVRDRSVLFFLNNSLQLISDGERYELDEFMPNSYRMSDDCIAWQDINGRLHIFSGGQNSLVSNEAIVSYELNGNVLKYNLRDGTSRIWCKGKVYGNN